MSDRSTAEPVVSGTPYEVVAVDGRPPQDLDCLVEAAVEVLSLASPRHALDVRGCARRVGETVVFHEKTAGGTGRDVRVWRIAVNGGRLEATVSSNY